MANFRKGLGHSARFVCAKALLAFLFLAVPVVVQAQFDYTVTTNDTATITDYTGPAGSITIPATIDDYPVTAIGYAAFENNPAFTEAIIPNSVVILGDLAFARCGNLTNIVIGSGVTNIGEIPHSFNGRPIADDDAFLYCTNLTAISVDAANPVYSSSNGVMFDKNQDTLIQFPGGLEGTYAIPDSVTNIGFESFAYSSLTHVTFDASATRIADYAFENCPNLASIMIPNSVTSIGNFSFLNCSNLMYVTIGNGVTNIGGGTITFNGRSMPDSFTFANCPSLSSAYFDGNAPSGDQTIFSGDPATVYYLFGATGWSSTFGGVPTIQETDPSQFNYATNFAYITNSTTVTTNATITITRYNPSVVNGTVPIPNVINGYPVTSIGNNAFFGISIILTNAIIPDSITSIGIQAFGECDALTNVFIPDSVTNVGIGAFQECFNLATITVDANNPAYASADGVLFDKNLSTIEQYPGGLAGSYLIPDSVTTIGTWAFFGQSEPTNVIIPDGVTNIEDDAFFGCGGLTNIFIPESVTSIGNGALQGCLNLTTIAVDSNNPAYSDIGGVLFDKSQTTLILYPGDGSPRYIIPDGVTTVGDSAFLFCNLTNITIPNSVTNIGFNAFSLCGLTNVIIPDSVTVIGPSAFGECPNLTNVIMSANVTSIGDYVFFDCPNLVSVYFPGNAPSFQFGTGMTLFESDSNLALYYLTGTTGWNDFSELTGIPVTPWLPQMETGTDYFGIQTNQFSFNVFWASGQTVVVDACTNLLNPQWQPQQTNTLTNCAAYFSDAQWTNYPSRYYRVRSQ